MTSTSACSKAASASSRPSIISDDDPLLLPVPDAFQLRIITSNLLEVTLVTTKAPEPAKLERWDFVASDGSLRLPPVSEFIVLGNGQPRSVAGLGFKRRVLYAPLKKRDLRLANSLYLRLSAPLSSGDRVEVKNSTGTLWPAELALVTRMDPKRYSPVLHVNQVGYVPNLSKRAMVGYYLGNLGELPLPSATGMRFQVIEVRTERVSYEGQLQHRRDTGFPDGSYQNVLEADFTEFTVPGEYRLFVEGLGTSRPFFVQDGVAAAFARAYALGLYHQRCGTNNAFPFTRFVHGPCHTAPAEVPTAQSVATLKFLAEATADFTNNTRHVAPRLKDLGSALYPFVKRGKIDVAGGHHDAGDYSKYTINSAGLIHTLVFAVDALPGVADLDNLGLPESGDGRSDVLEEAKWEADFLAKMQDTDGGVFFLVYPRDRKYENNVLPDQGDPQVVWPKNTAATAAAVAALAQIASSPSFRKSFPQEAGIYLARAKQGWAFLERALQRFGPDGAYQKLTHYGNEFMHDDELAWAACELFLATGDESFHRRLIQSFDPSDARTRRWGWWRLYECYGRAIRSYAFAAKSGRLKLEQLDREFLRRCEMELAAGADDALRWATQSAYGTSLPTENKKRFSAGWYFSLEQAFDLAVACALDAPPLNDPRPSYLDALLTNLNYEGGCNPVNVCFVTGLGWRRPFELVHHYAINDRRNLPPSGLPCGNLQSGFMWLDHYRKELGALSFPADGGSATPYALYDRWADSFNVQTEFVVLNQARALAVTAFLMGQTPLRNQPWKVVPGVIQSAKPVPRGNESASVATLVCPPLDPKQARVVWEAAGRSPSFGLALTNATSGWIEVEAQWPDGRRVFGVSDVGRSAR